VPLKDIESAVVNKKGQVKIAVPSRRDIIIPLQSKESKRLVDKLNELIPMEKERAERELEVSQRTRRSFETRISEARAGAEEAERLR